MPNFFDRVLQFSRKKKKNKIRIYFSRLRVACFLVELTGNLLKCFVAVSVFPHPTEEPPEPFYPKSSGFPVLYGLDVDVGVVKFIVIRSRANGIEDEC